MKTNRLRLDPTPQQSEHLRLLGDRVSALWNAANYVCRQAFLAGEKVLSYNALCCAFQSHVAYRALPSDIAQETLKKLSEAWKSYFQLRKRWQAGQLADKPGLPRYRKDRQTGERPTDLIPIKCDRSYRVSGRTVEVTVPRDVSTRRMVMTYRGIKRYVGKGRRAEVLYDAGRGRWYFVYGVDMPPAKPKPWACVAGVDLGIRVLASLSIEGEQQAFHFAGRDVLKEWDYWNRRIAEHQQALAQRGKKSSKRLQHLYAKRRTRLHHAWDAMAKRIAQLCRTHRVGKVVLGWPKGILDAVRANRKWQGRLHGFWSFAQMSARIELALNRLGIATERVGERGTSSHCPGCGSAHVVRRPRSVLRCKDCHSVMHADQAGSRNMIRQKYPVCWDGHEACPAPETWRFDKHRWVDAYNPPTVVRVGDLAA